MRITLNNRDRQLLSKLFPKSSGKQKIRFIAIKMMTENLNCKFISKVLNLSYRCILLWLNALIRKGVSGLIYKQRNGKKSRLNQFQKKKLITLIKNGPLKNGYQTTIWTSALVKEIIEKKFGITYHVNYIPFLLKKLGFSYKKMRAKNYQANLEDQIIWEEETFQEICQKAIRENGVILFEDESSAYQWSRLAYSWGIRGEKLETMVKVSSLNRKIYGALNLLTGDFDYQVIKGKNDQDKFRTFLDELSKKYQRVYLILDNGPVHKIGNHYKNIEFYFLPVYSPELNPIESLWKKLKRGFLHGRLFRNSKELDFALEEGLSFLSKNARDNQTLMSKWRRLFLALRVKYSSRINLSNRL